MARLKFQWLRLFETHRSLPKVNLYHWDECRPGSIRWRTVDPELIVIARIYQPGYSNLPKSAQSQKQCICMTWIKVLQIWEWRYWRHWFDFCLFIGVSSFTEDMMEKRIMMTLRDPDLEAPVLQAIEPPFYPLRRTRARRVDQRKAEPHRERNWIVGFWRCHCRRLCKFLTYPKSNDRWLLIPELAFA